METNNGPKYPDGHFVGMWMVIGIAVFSGLGVPLSVATGNYGLIGIGPAIGVAFGLALGELIESKYRKKGKIRPLTEEERKRKKALVIVLISVFALGVLVFLLRLYL
jgi:hypothetical protein